MSLLEWICESYNPGPTGDIVMHGNRRERTRVGAMFTGLLALGAFTVPFYAMYQSIGFDMVPFAVLFVGMCLYLLISYAVQPKPATSNLGWCGGLIDNPFRFSDDINRFLILMILVLLPGRLVAIGLVDLVHAFSRPGTK